MGLVLALYVILVFAIGIAKIYNVKYEETIPISTMCVMIELYIFYIFDKLAWGYYLIIIAAFVLTVVFLYNAIKKNTKMFSRNCICLTSSICAFVIALFVIYIFTQDNLVRLWDELRLWAAYPKALWYESELQMGASSLLYNELEATYIPGMPLLVYFFEMGLRQFKEHVIFFVYAFWICMLFLPVFSKWSSKKQKSKLVEIPLMLSVMLLTPLFFFNSNFDYGNFYKSLFIDPILGITLGFLFYLLTQDSENVKYKMFSIVVVSSTLVLLKDSGIFFAVVGVCFYVIDICKEKSKTINKRSLIITLICPLVIYFSWQCILRLYNQNPHAVDVSLVKLWDFEFIKRFMYFVFFEPIVRSTFQGLNEILTTGNILFFFITCNILIICLVPKNKKKNICWVSLGMLIVQIGFIVGLYVLCLKGFNKNIRSAPRYESAVLLGYLFYIINVVIDNRKNIFLKANGKIRIIPYICIVCLLFSFPYRVPTTYTNNEIFDEAHQIADTLTYRVALSENNNPSIYLLCDGYEEDYAALLHQRVYYNLIGKVFIKNRSYDKYLFYTYQEETLCERFDDFLYKLKEYDYVYVLKADPKIKELCGDFFEDLSDNALYKIETTTESICCLKVD